MNRAEHRELQRRLAVAVQGEEAAALLLKKRGRRTWFAAMKPVPLVEPRSNRRPALAAVSAAAVVSGAVALVGVLGANQNGPAVADAAVLPTPAQAAVSPAQPKLAAVTISARPYAVPSARPVPAAQPVVLAATKSPSVSVAPAPTGPASPSASPVVPPKEESGLPVSVEYISQTNQVRVTLDLGFGSPIVVETPPLTVQ